MGDHGAKVEDRRNVSQCGHVYMNLKGSVLRQEVRAFKEIQQPLVVGKGNVPVNEGGSLAPVRSQEVAFSLSAQQQQCSSL